MVAMTVWPTDAAEGSVATEARWRSMARAWTPSGVLLNVGGALAPTLTFPNLTVQAGAAWVDGHYCELPGPQVLTVTTTGLAVVRFDPAANLAELVYRSGATAPAQAPTGVWELPIALITASALLDVRPLVGRTGGSVGYKDVAARDKHVTWSPALVGDLSYLVDRPEQLWQAVTGGWVPVSGCVASAGIIAGTAGVAPMTDIPGLSITVQTFAGVTYEARFTGEIVVAGTVSNCEVYLRDGANTLLKTLHRGQYGGGSGAIFTAASGPFDPGAGTKTYKISTQSAGALIAMQAGPGAAAAVLSLWSGPLREAP